MWLSEIIVGISIILGTVVFIGVRHVITLWFVIVFVLPECGVECADEYLPDEALKLFDNVICYFLRWSL